MALDHLTREPLRSLAQATAVGLLALLAACGPRAPSEDQEPGSEPAEQAQTEDAAAVAETMEALESLGYVATAPTDNPEDRGVTVLEAGAQPGLNLYSTRHLTHAVLMDLRGNVVNEWKGPDDEKGNWTQVEPLPNGDLLVVDHGTHLTRYDWHSKRLWRHEFKAHHDVAVDADGNIFALGREPQLAPDEPKETPVLGDQLIVLAPDGRVRETLDLLPLVGRLVPRGRWKRIHAMLDDTPLSQIQAAGGAGDVLHTNSIALLTKDIPGVAPAGSVLLSFRSLGRIAILDADLEKVLWSWGRGELDAQHDATQLENGHLLVFDNGYHRGKSRVIEVDAARGEIVWSYEAPDFFTALRGGAQALPNGNVLVTESETGRAFEVTRNGDVVWQFWNPDVRHTSEGELRGVIYRLNRFPESFFAPLSRQGTAAAAPSTPDG